MHLKKYFLLSLLLSTCFLSTQGRLANAQMPSTTSQPEINSQIITELLAQLYDLQEQLKNLLKYEDGKPLNTVTEIIGPKTVTVGEYTTWKFVTKDKDPENSSPVMIDWGDGMTSATGSGHTYSAPGTYTIVATHHDGNGMAASLSFKVKVTPNVSTGSLTAWGNKLVSNKSLIPKNQFRSYFFDTKSFKVVSASEVVDQPFFFYPNDSFSIRISDQFQEHTLGAYWVGSFSYPKDTTVYLDFSDPQWDTVRFIIDGKTVIESSRRDTNLKSHPIKLKKGIHIIEVEYKVNWHAGFFRAKVGTNDPNYVDIKTAQVAARAIAGKSAVMVSLKEYSSGNTLTGITPVSISNTVTSKILDLSSYEATLWDVQGANTKGVKAIILSSFAGAADVINADTIPIFRTRNYSE